MSPKIPSKEYFPVLGSREKVSHRTMQYTADEDVVLRNLDEKWVSLFTSYSKHITILKQRLDVLSEPP